MTQALEEGGKLLPVMADDSNIPGAGWVLKMV